MFKEQSGAMIVKIWEKSIKISLFLSNGLISVEFCQYFFLFDFCHDVGRGQISILEGESINSSPKLGEVPLAAVECEHLPPVI